jgi:crossover junction endodeoxyribonuclease RusA
MSTAVDQLHAAWSANEVEFSVVGIPVAQGGMRAFVVGGVARVTNKNPKNLADWRRAIAQAAGTAMAQRGLFLGPVDVDVTFTLPRPRSHYGARGGVKPAAPVHVQTRPDLDKEVRALLDGITGVVVHDDAQVASLSARKVYGETPGCDVKVRRIE